MNGIEKSGYLSPEIDEWVKKHRSENPEWFRLAEDINSFAQEQMFLLDVHNRDYQEILTATAFVRSHSLYQGALLMLQRGMVYEAATLVRAEVEAMFVLTAAAKEMEFAKAYILSEKTQKLRLMKNILRSSSDLQNAIGDDATWGKVERLKDKLKKEGITEIQFNDIAKITEYYDWYTVVYTVLSQLGAHPTPRSLDQHLQVDSEGDIKSLLCGPNIYGIASLLSTAVECFIIILNSVSALFEMNWDENLNTYHDRLKGLTKTSKPLLFGHKST